MKWCRGRDVFGQTSGRFVRGGASPGGGGGILGRGDSRPQDRWSPYKRDPGGRGFDKEEQNAKERLERGEGVEDEEIPRLNPDFPYNVIEPDFTFFGVSADPVDKFILEG